MLKNNYIRISKGKDREGKSPRYRALKQDREHVMRRHNEFIKHCEVTKSIDRQQADVLMQNLQLIDAAILEEARHHPEQNFRNIIYGENR